jgi:hypothetical protein
VTAKAFGAADAPRTALLLSARALAVADVDAGPFPELIRKRLEKAKALEVQVRERSWF